MEETATIAPDFQQQGFSDPDPKQKLYKTLLEHGYYTKSFDEFKKQYSTPESVDKIYSVVNGDQLYTKSKDDFYNQYFSDLSVKKKDAGTNGLQVSSQNTPSNSTDQLPSQENKVSEYDNQNPIDLAKQSDELTKDKYIGATGGTGGTAPNFMPANEKDIHKSKDINSYLEKQGYDSKKLRELFTDFPSQAYDVADENGQKNQSQEKLLTELKNDPIGTESKINNIKTQFKLRDAAYKKAIDNGASENDASIYADQTGNYFLSLKKGVSSYPEFYNNIEKQKQVIDENLSGDEHDKALQKLEQGSSHFINATQPAFLDEYSKSEYKGVLTPNEYAGLKQLELFHPEEYKQAVNFIKEPIKDVYEHHIDPKYLEGFQAPVAIDPSTYETQDSTKKDGETSVKISDKTLNEKLGLEYIKSKLATIGRQNALTNLSYRFSNTDDPQQQQQIKDVASSIQSDTANDASRYPMLNKIKLDQEVKDKLNKEPGLANYTAMRFAHQAGNIGETFQNLFNNNTALQRQRLGENIDFQNDLYIPKNISSDKNVFSKASAYTMAGFLGDVGGIAFSSAGMPLGKTLKTLVPMFLTSQSDFYKEAVEKGNSNPNEYANLHAGIVSLAALFGNRLDYVKKIAGGKLSPLLDEVDEKTWDKVIAENGSKISKIKSSMGNALGENLKQTAIWGGGVPLLHSLADKGFYDDKTPWNDVADNIYHSMKDMFIGGLIPMGIHSITGYKNIPDTQKAFLWELGDNKDMQLEKIDENIKSGQLTPEEGNKRKDVVNNISDLISKVPSLNDKGQPLTDEQRSDYLYNSFIKDRANKLKKDLPEAQKEKLENISAKIDNENNEILTKKQPTLSSDQSILKDAVDNGEVIGAFADGAKEAAKNPEKTTGYLKEVADQANNVNNESGLFTDEQARTTAEAMFGKNLVEIATKRFPKNETPIQEADTNNQQGNISTEEKKPIDETVNEGKQVAERSKNADIARDILDEVSTDKNSSPLTFKEKDNIHNAINAYEKGGMSGEDLRKTMISNGVDEKYIGKKLIEKNALSDAPETKGQLTNKSTDFDHFKEQMLSELESRSKDKFDLKINHELLPVEQKTIEQGIKNIREGRDTKAAQQVEAAIKKMYDDGVVHYEAKSGKIHTQQPQGIPASHFIDISKESNKPIDINNDDHLHELNMMLGEDAFPHVVNEESANFKNQTDESTSKNDTGEGTIQQPSTRKPAENNKETTGDEGSIPPQQSGAADATEGEDGHVTSLMNKVTDKKRVEFGLSPAMQSARKEFGVTWDNAMKQIEDGYNPQDLVNSLKKKIRPLNDEENAILLKHQIDKETELRQVNEAINKAAEKGDDSSLAENKIRKARVQDDLQDIYDVGKKAGTENARGLATRQMLANDDYSLAAMVAKKRAANNGAQLSEQQMAAIEKQHKEVQEKLTAYENKIKELEQKVKELQANKKYATKEKAQAVADRLRKLKINKGDKLQANLAAIPTAIWDGAVETVATAIEQGGNLVEAIQKGIDHLQSNGYLKLKDDVETFSNLMYAGIGEERKFVNLLDPEVIKAKASYERAKAIFDADIYKDEQKAKGKLSNIADFFVKWERAGKLSWPTTIAKLASAGLTRLAQSPIEDIIGTGIGAAIPKVRAKAYGEAGFNVKAQAKSFVSAFTQGIKDARDVMRKGTLGKSDLDFAFGDKKVVLPPEVAEFFGHLHGAIKAPIKRGIFEKSLLKRATAIIKSGADLTDPLTQSSIALDAYKDANRAIFMQDNILSDAYQKLVQGIESGKDFPTVRKYIASGMQWMIPFVKVPTNIVGETATLSGGGLIFGGAKLLHTVFTKGLDKLSTNEADMIMRNLKKGALGSALMLYGYFNPNAFGGFYQPFQKQKEGELKSGQMNLFGVTLPSWLLHAPLFNVMQLGATMRKLQNKYAQDGDKNAEFNGIMAGALGLAKEVPLIDQPIEIAKLFDAKERQYYAGELMKNTIDPGLIQFAAKVERGYNPWTEQTSRKADPKTITEHVETGLPVLTENVPNRTQFGGGSGGGGGAQRRTSKPHKSHAN